MLLNRYHKVAGLYFCTLFLLLCTANISLPKLKFSMWLTVKHFMYQNFQILTFVMGNFINYILYFPEFLEKYNNFYPWVVWIRYELRLSWSDRYTWWGGMRTESQQRLYLVHLKAVPDISLLSAYLHCFLLKWSESCQVSDLGVVEHDCFLQN